MPNRATPKPSTRSKQLAGSEAPSPSTYSVVYQDPRCVMVTYKNLSIVVWGSEATLERMEHLEHMSLGLSKAHPDGISAIHIIQDNAALPSAEVRQRLAALTNRHSKDLACVATLIGGEGFWASAMRGLVTGIHWLERRPFKTHICATHEEVADLLLAPHVARTRVAIGRAELIEVLSNARGLISHK